MARAHSCRGLLAQAAGPSDAMAGRCQPRTCPQAVRPASDAVRPAPHRMLSNGYLDEAMTYDETIGSFF